MIRRHLFALRLLLLTADAATAMLVFTIVGLFRFGDADWDTLWHALNVDVGQGTALYAATWVVMLWYLGLYELRVRWTVRGELNDIMVASFMLAFGTMSFLYLAKLDVSRLFLLILLVAQPTVTIAGRVVLRALFAWFRTRGYNRVYMLVVGTGRDAQAFSDAVEAHRDLGIEVIGHLRGPDREDGEVTRPIVGEIEDLQRLFHERVVDEVAICVGPDAAEWSERLTLLAASEGKHVRVPTFAEARPFDLQVEELDGLVVRSYAHGPARMLSLALKRAMDVAVASIGLVVASPVFLAVAITILARDGRPILFHQPRDGLQGRPFTVHKFRTMVPDAEAHLADVRHLNERNGIVFKAADDPRVTRLGRFLRATSIDELPQLWNVLVGEMSLVGPRPPLAGEVSEYDVWHRRRLSMKPGITGLWQVEARTDPEFDHWVERDLAYIDRWSLFLDLRILIKTVPAVVGKTGR